MPAKVKTKNCKYRPCGRPFIPINDWHKFDKPKCRIAHFKAEQLAFIKHAKKIMNAQPGK